MTKAVDPKGAKNRREARCHSGMRHTLPPREAPPPIRCRWQLRLRRCLRLCWRPRFRPRRHRRSCHLRRRHGFRPSKSPSRAAASKGARQDRPATPPCAERPPPCPPRRLREWKAPCRAECPGRARARWGDRRRYRLSPCASWCPAEALGRGTAEGSPPRKWAEGTVASHGRRRDRRPSRQRGTAPPRPPPPRRRRPRRTPRGAAPARSMPLSPHASSLSRIRTVRDNFRRPFALIARRAAKRFRRAALR